MIYMFLHGNILYSNTLYNIRIIYISFNVQSQAVDGWYRPQVLWFHGPTLDLGMVGSERSCRLAFLMD